MREIRHAERKDDWNIPARTAVYPLRVRLSTLRVLCHLLRMLCY
jgi:hypothetical protein